jgi:hypothetical protein
MPIGSTTDVTVDRNGKRLDFKVAIGERSVIWQGESQVTENEPKETTPLATSNKTPAVRKVRHHHSASYGKRAGRSFDSGQERA